jgi:hypothetical protein
MPVLSICPTELDLCVTRGDSTAFSFNLQDQAGSAIDIAGFTFLLTVDPSDAPADDTGNLFQISGTITDGPGGVVQFAPTPANNTPPGDYFFDVEWTATGAIRTIIKGKYTIKQDITKP